MTSSSPLPARQPPVPPLPLPPSSCIPWDPETDRRRLLRLLSRLQPQLLPWPAGYDLAPEQWRRQLLALQLRVWRGWGRLAVQALGGVLRPSYLRRVLTRPSRKDRRRPRELDYTARKLQTVLAWRDQERLVIVEGRWQDSAVAAEQQGGGFDVRVFFQQNVAGRNRGADGRAVRSLVVFRIMLTISATGRRRIVGQLTAQLSAMD